MPHEVGHLWPVPGYHKCHTGIHNSHPDPEQEGELRDTYHTVCMTMSLYVFVYNVANLVNVKVHLSWHLQLHSKIAASSPDARRKINLTCEVPKDKCERTKNACDCVYQAVRHQICLQTQHWYMQVCSLSE